MNLNFKLTNCISAPKSDTCQEISKFETNKIIVSEVNDYYKNHKKDINEQFNVSIKDSNLQLKSIIILHLIMKITSSNNFRNVEKILVIHN